MRDQTVDRTELIQKRGGGLGTDPLDAGDVVGTVSDQREVVNDSFRFYAEFRDRFRNAPLMESFGIVVGNKHLDTVVDHLGDVLVRGDDQDFAVAEAFRRRRDQIIRFGALPFDDVPAEGPDHFPDRVELAAQILRHRRAVRLVGGREKHSLCRTALVEYEGAVIAFILVPEFQQEFRHGEHRVCGRPLRGGEPADRVIPAVDLGIRVDQKQRCGHDGVSFPVISPC